MTKLDLENDLMSTRHELNQLKKNINKGLIEALENDPCEEGKDAITTFCTTAGVPLPTKEVIIKILHGETIGEVYNEEGDSIDYDELVA